MAGTNKLSPNQQIILITVVLCVVGGTGLGLLAAFLFGAFDEHLAPPITTTGNNNREESEESDSSNEATREVQAEQKYTNIWRQRKLENLDR